MQNAVCACVECLPPMLGVGLQCLMLTFQHWLEPFMYTVYDHM